jgi:hypothetical protein
VPIYGNVNDQVALDIIAEPIENTFKEKFIFTRFEPTIN